MGVNGLNGVVNATTFAAGLQKRKAELSANGTVPKTAVTNKPKNEQQKKSYKNIFTREVVEGWHKLVDEGWNVQRIGRENGLAVVDGNTIRAYLKKYPRPSVTDVTNPPAPTTAAARVDDVAVTAVAKPDAATVLTRLAALVGELQGLGCVVKVSVGLEVAYGNE